MNGVTEEDRRIADWLRGWKRETGHLSARCAWRCARAARLEQGVERLERFLENLSTSKAKEVPYAW